ncbi:MAG: hypothetical protein KAU36_05510, partial [candidate division Zixibacteria bacterium]|nr:hypothetical protein [candidate division Zixibacteria bacterium]
MSDGVVTAVLIAVLAAVSLPCSVCSQAGVGGVITAEPLFTAGTSNTIDFDTAAISGTDVYEVCFFDDAVPGVHACIPSGSSKSLGGATLTSVVFEDLDDGHTYSYYVQAHFISADSIVFSDTTSSTQDASPPQIVSDATAQTEPGGIAVVDWTGVADAISSLGQYHILRKLAGQSYDVVDSVTPGATGDPHTYRDSLGGGTGLIEGEAQLYRVRAVDIVGNGIDGNEAGPVAPDSTLPDTVVLTPEGAYYDGDTAYLAGVRTKVTARSNGSGPARADSIRFEWVRDSVAYFDSHWQPGRDYDSSGWMPYEPDSFYWDTSLLPPNGDTDYVHNHYYLFRAQAKDTSGNITGWSDTIGAYMDAYPPSDIANLTVGPKPDPVGVACVMLVEWDAATDAGSGVGRYYIHRKVGSGPSAQFDSIDFVDGGVTLYEDSCCGLNERDTLTYRIWSRDNAGNLRSSTVWEAGGWPPMPPIISASCDITVEGLCFVQLKTIVTWLGYKTTYVTGYRVDVNGATHDIADPAQLVDTIPLSSDTVWNIKVRSFFNDGNVSIWSAAQHVRRDHSAPNPVDAFEVVADESYTGNIFLSWSKPWDSAAASDVVRYNIYRKKPADADYELIDFTLTNDNDNYPNDGTIYTDLYADPGDDTLIAFQWYLYQSQPIDMLGNERHNPEPVDSAYCTRPPMIDSTDVGGDHITIWWWRASPNKADTWYNRVKVYK